MAQRSYGGVRLDPTNNLRVNGGGATRRLWANWSRTVGMCCVALGLALADAAAAESIGQTNSFLGITFGADFPGATEICEPETTVRCVRPNGAKYFEMRNEPDLGFPYKVIVLTENGKAAEMLLSFRRAKLPAMQDLLKKRFDAPSSTKVTPVEFSFENDVDVSRDSLWVGSTLVLWLSEIDPEEEGGSMLQVLRREAFDALLREEAHRTTRAASQL